MTPTEKARRIDALVQGPEGRRDLACMIVNREADLEDALAENAALLEECDGWKKVCVDQEVMHVMREETLDNENAKLRECLQDLAEHIREDDGFGLDYGWMLDRMRELGVEVNA